MNSVLENNLEKILIVTPDYCDLDLMISSKVFAEILASIGKQVTLLIDKNRLMDSVQGGKLPENVSVLDRIISNDFYVDLPLDREISSINVEKNTGNFRIVVNTKSGTLVENTLNLKRKKAKFDLIILFGFNRYENSKHFLDVFGKSLIAKKTLLINHFESEVKTDSKYIVNSSCFSELVKIIALKMNFALSGIQATELLIGVIFATKNFKMNCSRQLMKNSYLLVNKDKANLGQANRVVNQGLTKEHALWFEKIFSNLTIYKNFCYSYIQDGRINSEYIGKLNKEDRIVISRVQGCDVALVLFKLGRTTHGFLQSNIKEISALELTGGYLSLGDSRFVHFWTEDSPEKVLDFVSSGAGIEKKLTLKRIDEIKTEKVGVAKPEEKGRVEKPNTTETKVLDDQTRKTNVSAENPGNQGVDISRTENSVEDTANISRVGKTEAKQEKVVEHENTTKSQNNSASMFFDSEIAGKDIFSKEASLQNVIVSNSPSGFSNTTDVQSLNARLTYKADNNKTNQQIGQSRDIQQEIMERQMLAQRLRQVQSSGAPGRAGFVPSNYDPLPPAEAK